MSNRSVVTGWMRPTKGAPSTTRSIARASASSQASPTRTWMGHTSRPSASSIASMTALSSPPDSRTADLCCTRARSTARSAGVRRAGGRAGGFLGYIVRMYLVTKRIDFCYGHRLLDYDGVCKHPHGHNAVVEVDVRTDELDGRNMVVDFSDIKRIVNGWIDTELDHKM